MSNCYCDECTSGVRDEPDSVSSVGIQIHEIPLSRVRLSVGISNDYVLLQRTRFGINSRYFQNCKKLRFALSKSVRE
jgi:hypothetical protein